MSPLMQADHLAGKASRRVQLTGQAPAQQPNKLSNRRASKRLAQTPLKAPLAPFQRFPLTLNTYSIIVRHSDLFQTGIKDNARKYARNKLR